MNDQYIHLFRSFVVISIQSSYKMFSQIVTYCSLTLDLMEKRNNAKLDKLFIAAVFIMKFNSSRYLETLTFLLIWDTSYIQSHVNCFGNGELFVSFMGFMWDRSPLLAVLHPKTHAETSDGLSHYYIKKPTFIVTREK